MYNHPSISSSHHWPLVLYFHHITDEFEHYTAIGRDKFRRALELCLEHYGSPLDPYSIETAICNGDADEPKFLVTFDDGYRNAIENGVSVLDDLRIKALFFLTYNGLVHGRCDGMRTPRAEFFGFNEAEELKRCGHRLGGHTANHFSLGAIAASAVREEVEPPPALRELLVIPNFIFAYPYGDVAKQHMPDISVAFGTVKSPPRPWNGEPMAVRRTYFPTGEEETWTTLVEGWRKQWHQR